MASDDELLRAAINIDTVEDAEFTVNRYTVSDGRVVEEQLDADIGGEDMDALKEEIGGAIDEKMAEFDRTGETPTERDIATPDETDDSDEDGADEAEAAETEADIAEDEAYDIALEVVEAEGITKSNWPTFASAMRDEGVSDQDLLSTVWNRLRDNNELVGAEESDDDSTDETDESGAESEESTDTSDGVDTEDDEQEPGGVDESQPVGEVLEEADEALLAVNPGLPNSDEAIDQFDGLIREGLIETLNVDTNLDAEDILEDAGLGRKDIPAVLIREGSEWRVLGADPDPDDVSVDTDEAGDPDEDAGGDVASGVRFPDAVERDGVAETTIPSNTTLAVDITSGEPIPADEYDGDIEPGDVVAYPTGMGAQVWAVVFPEETNPPEGADEFTDAPWFLAENIILGGPGDDSDFLAEHDADGDGWLATAGYVETDTAIPGDLDAIDWIIPDIEGDDVDVPDDAGDGGGDDADAGGEPPADADVTDVTPSDLGEIGAGDQLLLVRMEEESSEKLVNALAGAITEGEVVATPVGSEVGEALVEQLPDDIRVPLALEAVEGGFARRELEDVVDEYT